MNGGDGAVEVGRDASEDTALEASYRAESERLLHSRLAVGVTFFLVAMGIGSAVEAAYYPDRAAPLAVVDTGYLILCVTSLVYARRQGSVVRAWLAASTLAMMLTLLMCWYHGAVGALQERLAMAEVCLLSTFVVLLPWGWQGQLVTALASLGGFAVAAPSLQGHETLAFTIIVLVTGATTSVWGAYFLERYRHDGFLRTALLTRASAALAASKERSEEEKEIAAALVRVGETLSAHLDQPDMLERVNRLTLETMRCDWSATYLWDQRRDAFRLAAGAGIGGDVAAELAAIDFTMGSFPGVSLVFGGETLELSAADEQAVVPRRLLTRWDVTAALCVPVVRREQVIGAMAHGYRAREGTFSPKQRRLAAGIAHATATALENARLIADLQTASRLKSEFVSTMSHELRTPLNVILGFCEMATDAALNAKERGACVDKIEAAGRELLALIESTLEIGKFEVGREDLRLERVPLPTLWAELGSGCAALPRNPDVVLEWSGDVPDVTLQTDPHKLGIVVRNLVGNALKFTERGWVRAEVTRAADEVVLRVADTGIGIRAEDRDAIFQMFRQADGSDSRRFGGVGLGLYIVRRFVEQLGGTIDLESAPGRGSVFTVRLRGVDEPGGPSGVRAGGAGVRKTSSG
jgi:signal transduction histidine kinase